VKAKEYNLRKIYICRYEDGDVEFCTFHTNQADARKSRTSFKRKFGVVGSVELQKVSYTKKGFIDLFNRYGIKYRQR